MRKRSTLARHARYGSPGAVVTLLKLTGVALAVVVVAGLGVSAYTVYDWTSSYVGSAVDIPDQADVPPDIGEIEGGVDLLLVGTDLCEEELRADFPGRCDGPDAGGEHNDVNLLIHLSDDPRRVTTISFPRDLMIGLPPCTDPVTGQTFGAVRKEMLNVAYSRGGLGCVTRTIESISGQSIEYAAKITWGGVIKITDAIGGVTVCLASPIRDVDNTGIDWPAGERTVVGKDALEFLRTRHGLVGGSDLSRIANQQQYMSKLVRKMASDEVLSNPATMFGLASTIVHSVTPSQSLTNPVTLVQIGLALKSVPFDEIVFVQYPVLADPDNGNRVIPNEDAAAALWAALDANQQIQLTGPPGQGVVGASPSPTPVPTSAPDGTPQPQPSETSVALPSGVTGQTAEDTTCSNGAG